MTQHRPLPPLETLREAFTYDPGTGELRWRSDRACQVRAGDLAGTRRKGYLRVNLGERSMAVHRIAWYLHYGTDPGPLEVDHANRDRSDNRIANLRLVNGHGNRANTPCADRPVEVEYPDGQTLELSSVAAAGRFFRRDPATVRKYIRGRISHPEGLTFRHLEA